jgi:hypothetical protein
MRFKKCMLTALVVPLLLTAFAAAQPPDRRGPPRGGPGGGGGGPPRGPEGALERVLDDMKLSERKHDSAVAAVRTYADNGRRLSAMAAGDLLLKMKEILSPDEFKKLKEATDEMRAGPGGGPGRSVSADELVERIMSFDKAKKGKVVKEDLPERMQDLVERGDLNKDGALDREEIKKLAAELAKDDSAPGRAFGRGDGPPPPGNGRGPPPPPGGRGGGPGGPGGLPIAAAEKAIGDLKLSESKNARAAEAMKTYRDNLRQLTDLARADLMLKVSDVLNDEELVAFKTAVDRLPRFGDRPIGRDGRPGPPPPPPPRRKN